MTGPSGTSESARRDGPGGIAPIEPKEGNLEGILYDVTDGVARVTFDRPDSYNAYTTDSLVSLRRAVQSAAFDDRIGVIVLTGVGTDAFCTGGDVKEYAERYTRRPRDYWKYMQRFREAVEALLRCGKPTIARLNGMTIGGGNEMHLACDLSVAADHALIGQAGVGVGSVACGGATQWLPLAVGDRRARAMLMLNERIYARKAKEWGLVVDAVPSVKRDGAFVEDPGPDAIEKARNGDDAYRIDLTPLDERVDGMAERVLGLFPECLRYTKQQVNFFKELAWDQTVGHASDWLALHFASLEPYEGMTAFTEKRDPDVRGIRRRMAEGGSSEFLHGPPARTCEACGARGLPDQFDYCGACGEAIGS